MATATIQVAYEAETTSLKATVNEINQINDKVVQGAQDSAAKVKKEYTGIANSFAAAFSGGQAKKALDNQAKAIDNVGKSGKSLTGQLRGLKQELSALEIAGQDGTKAFNDLLITAAKLEDQIGDTRARVKILASDTFKFDAAVGATQALASGFELAQGAAALFGEENEDLQKALVKITAATAVANSVQQISSLIKEESAVKTAVLTAATAAYNTVVGTSTGLLRAFKLALAGTGIGLLVLAITELVSYFMELQAQSAKTQTVFERFKDTFANAKTAIEGYRDAIISAQSRIDVALGRTSKLQASINETTREQSKQLGKDLAPLIVAQEKLRKEYEADLALRNDRNADFDARIEANNRLTKRLNDLRVVEAEVIKVRNTGQQAIKLNIQALKDEENASKQANTTKDDSIKKVKELTLEYIKMSESLDDLNKDVKLNAELTELDTRSQAEQLNSRVLFLQAEEAAGDKSLANRIKIIETEGEAKKAALEFDVDRANKIKIIDAETQKAITDATQTEFQKRIDLAFQYAAAVTSLFSQLNELSKQASEQRIADITLQSEKELEAINATTDLERDKERQRAALAKRTAAAISAEKTQQAKQDKALALFEIGVNTAKGIVSALGTTPPNPILAAFIAVTGALQLAAVAAKPIPKFEKGGVVGGRLHSGGGTMVEAERDEYIVNRKQSMRHRSELDAINSSSDAFRRLIEQRYVRPALMDYVAGNRNKQGVIVNASLNSKSMEKELRGMRKDLSKRNMTININQQDSRYLWQ
jgi:hypothetical protein